jgi:serine/threonine-protein kinase RsbT
VTDEVRVPINADSDVVSARRQGRVLAEPLGFSSSELTFIATAISEVARNIVRYAGQGTIILQRVREGGKRGLLVVALDQGPGIANIAHAMQDGYSSSGSLGMGLPGAKRLMDEFDIVSEVGKGTRVSMRKWAR